MDANNWPPLFEATGYCFIPFDYRIARMSMRLANGSHGYPSAEATIACCIQLDIHDAFLSEPATGMA